METNGEAKQIIPMEELTEETLDEMSDGELLDILIGMNEEEKALKKRIELLKVVLQSREIEDREFKGYEIKNATRETFKISKSSQANTIEWMRDHLTMLKPDPKKVWMLDNKLASKSVTSYIIVSKIKPPKEA